MERLGYGHSPYNSAGIYLGDGIVTYAGFQSMSRLVLGKNRPNISRSQVAKQLEVTLMTARYCRLIP